MKQIIRQTTNLNNKKELVDIIKPDIIFMVHFIEGYRMILLKKQYIFLFNQNCFYNVKFTFVLQFPSGNTWHFFLSFEKCLSKYLPIQQ